MLPRVVDEAEATLPQRAGETNAGSGAMGAESQATLPRVVDEAEDTLPQPVDNTVATIPRLHSQATKPRFVADDQLPVNQIDKVHVGIARLDDDTQNTIPG